MSVPVAERLAEFAVWQRDATLPAPVRGAVVRHVVDQMAVQLDGCERPSVQLVRSWARANSRDGRAVVVGTDLTLAPSWAAMVNAAAATAFENDDFHPGGLIHAYSAVVPAVLAYAEETEHDWETVLRAIAVGVESATRISIAGQPGMNSSRGIHPTSAVAPFGVALAIGFLRGLDRAELTHALGICGSFAGGVLEYSRAGGQVKRLHTGVAAEAGMRAVELASAGLDGPSTVVEGTRGVLAAFSDSFDPLRHPRSIVADLGLEWVLMGTSIKPYFTNGLIQGPIHAALELCARHDISPDEIEGIRVGVDSMAASVCAPTSIPPRDLVDAQFSLPFGVALAVVTGGSTLAEYEDAERAGFDVPEVTALASRVEVYVDAVAEELFPQRFTSTVEIQTARGRHRATVDAPGTPQNPLSNEQLEMKWRTALDRRRPGRFDAIWSLAETAGSPRELTAHLRASPIAEAAPSPETERNGAP